MRALSAIIISTVVASAVAACTHRTVSVSSAKELTSALNSARPGDIIRAASGVYKGNFVVPENAQGKKDCRIRLEGSGSVVLQGKGVDTFGYGLNTRASFWDFYNFEVTDSSKGIMADNSVNCTYEKITVHHIADEGVHFRSSSSYNVLRACSVYDTGLVQPEYGECVYIGSDKGKWVDGKRDACDYNVVTKCHLGPNCRAEPIDIKEGTLGGVIDSNTFDGSGIAGQNSADSWIDLKGSKYTIVGNTGSTPNAAVIVDGFQVHKRVDGWGTDNYFARNVMDVGGDGYGIMIQSGLKGNVVCSNNKVKNAAKGLSNVKATNCRDTSSS